MPTLIVENVPMEVYERLQKRAASRQRSIPEETLHLLKEVLRGAEGPSPRLPDFLASEEISAPCDLPRSSSPEPVVSAHTLREAFKAAEIAKQFFWCNTDRGASIKTERGVVEPGRNEPGYTELENRMRKRRCAAAWTAFQRPCDMEKVNPLALIFMYANGAGIIGIGRAEEKCKILYDDDPDRIRTFEESGHGQGNRIKLGSLRKVA